MHTSETKITPKPQTLILQTLPASKRINDDHNPQLQHTCYCFPSTNEIKITKLQKNNCQITYDYPHVQIQSTHTQEHEEKGIGGNTLMVKGVSNVVLHVINFPSYNFGFEKPNK